MKMIGEIIMSTKQNGIEPKRIEKNANSVTVAGLSKRYLFSGPMNPAAQWQKLGPYLGRIPGQKGNVAYGVCFDMANREGIEYFCGVEVSDEVNASVLPDGFELKQLPSFSYAVFDHEGHISSIRLTCDAIWKEWTPNSGYSKPEKANFFFERYGEKFNPRKGMGDIEIWIPITS